jgi:hypothetical protein
VAEVCERRRLCVLREMKSQDVWADSWRPDPGSCFCFCPLAEIVDIGSSHVQVELIRGGEVCLERPVAVVRDKRVPGRVPNQRLSEERLAELAEADSEGILVKEPTGGFQHIAEDGRGLTELFPLDMGVGQPNQSLDTNGDLAHRLLEEGLVMGPSSGCRLSQDRA